MNAHYLHEPPKPPVVWTLAGSDSSAGAGIQADIKTFAALGVHGASAVTALTAQNSHGVDKVDVPSASFFQSQLHALLKDMPPVALKSGMIPNQDMMEVILDFFIHQKVDYVCDPVMISTSGHQLMDSPSMEMLKNKLLPLATLITPNVLEAEVLVGRKLFDFSAIESAANEILGRGAKNVLIKGGHLHGPLASDYFASAHQKFWIHSPRQEKGPLHGTGCTLSAAITALMARGYPVVEAVVAAKAYLNEAIANAFKLPLFQISFLGEGQFPCHPTHFPWISKQAKPPEYLDSPSFVSSPEKLYAIASSVQEAQRFIDGGVTLLQLRLKEVDPTLRRTQVEWTVKYAREKQVSLYINDYWKEAIEFKAHGVHLGQSDLDQAHLDEIKKAGLRLGVSTHSLMELAMAKAIHPSYIALGPIFPTTTKEMPWLAQGMLNATLWRKLTSQALVLIGGIGLDHFKDLLALSPDALAVLREVRTQESIASYLEKIRRLSMP